jgi:nitroreductase
MESIYHRRSIRKYRLQPIPAEILRQILNAGRMAPSGKNRQPWRFLVYEGDKKAELLCQMKAGLEREASDPILPNSRYNLPDAWNTLHIMQQAPVVVMVLNPYGINPFDNISSEKRVTEIVDLLSIGAAVQNMLLQAESLGIGTLWIGNTFFAYPELMEYMQAEGQLTGAVALGYADESPSTRPRKTLDEITEYYI